MLTIQLSEWHKTAVSQDLPENISEEFEALKAEIKDLKQQLAKVSTSPAPKETRKNTAKGFTFKVDRGKILKIMEETVADSRTSRAYLDALKGAWNEILDSISSQDRALLNGSEPVLANQENAILAFEAAFNAEQVMKRSNLNDMFGNILSKAAGFSPNILAVPRKDFDSIRQEFAQKLKKQKQGQVPEEKQDTSFIPEGFDFLAEKIQTVDD